MVPRTVPRLSWLSPQVLILVPALTLLGAGCQSILGLDGYTSDPGEPGGEGGDSGTGGGGPQATGGGPPTTCERSADCDDNNDCTKDACQAGKCTFETVPGGDACEGGVCNGIAEAEKCQACVDDQPDSEVDAGCSEAEPQCRTAGKVRCVACATFADCDDNNDCTRDACQLSGVCEHSARAAGFECEGGICNGNVDNACVTCLDTEEELGVDQGCDEEKPVCDGAKCLRCQDSGDDVDLGCSEGAPNCDETSGLCFSECSNVECDNDGCKIVPDDTACPAAGGCPGRCDPAQGCVARAQKTDDTLITDKSFEEFETPWAASQSINGGDYEPYNDVTLVLTTVVDPVAGAYDGEWIARFPTDPDLGYDLFQSFKVPEGAIKLKFSGYYRSSVSDPGAGDTGDYFFGSLYDYDLNAFGPYFLTTESGKDYSVAPLTNGWTHFEYELTDLSNLPADGNAELNFVGRTNSTDPAVYYELDSVDVVATVCE
jgi:hypothetical protein